MTKKVVIIGAGVMGLAAAWQAVKNGHKVTLLESADETGGMAAHFDLNGLSIERFYHFICKTDIATFQLLKELNIEDKLKWRKTSMGYYYNNKLQDWGNPLALLKFTGLSLVEKFRYALFAFVSVKRNSWNATDKISAPQWIKQWCGEAVYIKLWKRLFELKFYHLTNEISAQWIWTRIRRIGRSRISLFQEELGYLEGGSETLVKALTADFLKFGGILKLNEGVKKIIIENEKIKGVETEHNFYPADEVISTIPTPLIAKIAPDLPANLLKKYEDIKNIGVVCLIFNLKKSLSPHFWVNISDENLPIPGAIEFSNLRKMNGHIVYVPYYMPVENELWQRANNIFIEEAYSALQKVNLNLKPEDLIEAYAARLTHAQPICEPGFISKLPPVMTSIEGLHIADTCFYYPEDRGISESVNLGRKIINNIERKK